MLLVIQTWTKLPINHNHLLLVNMELLQHYTAFPSIINLIDIFILRIHPFSQSVIKLLSVSALNKARSTNSQHKSESFKFSSKTLNLIQSVRPTVRDHPWNILCKQCCPTQIYIPTAEAAGDDRTPTTTSTMKLLRPRIISSESSYFSVLGMFSARRLLWSLIRYTCCTLSQLNCQKFLYDQVVTDLPMSPLWYFIEEEEA